jgi:hypothetical protein
MYIYLYFEAIIYINDASVFTTITTIYPPTHIPRYTATVLPPALGGGPPSIRDRGLGDGGDRWRLDYLINRLHPLTRAATR